MRTHLGHPHTRYFFRHCPTSPQNRSFLHLPSPDLFCRRTINSRATSIPDSPPPLASLPVPRSPPPLAIYVHWPYCQSHCTYCNFNKYVVAQPDVERLTSALDRELRTSLAERPPNQVVRSIYFGGGTPSLAPPATLAKLLNTVQHYCRIDPATTEITLEANPTTLETGKLRAFRALGINRLSLGLQALNEPALRQLGRNHSVTEALRALAQCHALFPSGGGGGMGVGVGGVTFDLIYGRPDQSTVSDWVKELNIGLECAGSHMSLYELTWKRGTALFRALEAGKLQRASDDLLSEMYEATIETCAAHRFHHYEVSSFARLEAADSFPGPGPTNPPDLVNNGSTLLANPQTWLSWPHQSSHNSAYWRGLDYVGIGPGAHGRVTDPQTGRRKRTIRIPHPPTWMQQCEELGHGLRLETELTDQEAREELLMFGLRMREGLPLSRLRRYGNTNDLGEMIDMARMQELVESGHLNWGTARVFDDAPPKANLTAEIVETLPVSMTLWPTAKGIALVDSILPRLLHDKTT
ncbi:hypothetical protein H4R33_002114 [Dimargaris cristalligena]|uniref:Radical SAM core domain-containing protein n=1 Tax=Dimargaris cristalligena TaxID=215637 RepID=A0A4P9ZKJ9_9FUNG|nr:hypothetical protein H4R33_002114 [Dimargaris cristalligena]RKP33784.1 hypothetical protein BJ085DRAFT_39785 [Dimargaris cristalligena]|eukprot:RKP33784.1 hypothetical protein BJ085DRAFT_39785 [Dimargaris cristalligena]